MKKKKVLLHLLFLLFSVCSVAFVSNAQADQISFYVTPKLPDNQITPNAGFFYLKMSPNQQEQTSVTLTNNSDQSVTVDITPASAKTANSGMVSYMPLPKISNDPSLQYDLTKYMKVESKVTIPAKQSVEVPVTITMPNATFDGVIAGGLTFKQEGQQTKPAKNAHGVSVINNYQFVMAVVIRQNMNIIPPVISLKSVEPSQVNSRNVVNIGLQNSAKAFLNNMAMHIDIKGVDRNNSNVHFKQDEQNLQMAPNSNLEWHYRLNGKSFIPGKYHTIVEVWGDQSVTGTYSDTVNGKTTKYTHYWKFEKDFTITEQKAQSLNKSDVSIPKPQINWSLWIIIGLTVLIIILAFLLILAKRRKKEEEEEITE